MFRAKTLKDKRVVKGYWCVVEGKHFIIPEDANTETNIDFLESFHKINPQTLAQKTGISDKHKTPIYGSFPIEGKMTEGGDRVKADNWQFHVIWQKYGWGLLGVNRGWWRQFTEFDDIEVIGPEEKRNKTEKI